MLPDDRGTNVAFRGGRAAANLISDQQASTGDRGNEPTTIKDPLWVSRLQESGRASGARVSET